MTRLAPAELASAGLRGRRASLQDLDDLRRLYRDPEVLATLSPDGLAPPENVVRSHMDATIRHWDDHGFGIWFWRSHGDEFAGRAGLRVVEIDGARETELLYAFMPRFWGRGLATETSKVIVRVAFATLDLTDLVAFTLPDNQGSRRVMEKCGLAYERDIVYAGHEHVLYRLSASAWRRAEARS